MMDLVCIYSYNMQICTKTYCWRFFDVKFPVMFNNDFNVPRQVADLLCSFYATAARKSVLRSDGEVGMVYR